MIFCIFGLILIGLLLGKIRICGVQIGLAGVLILSLLLGFVTSKGSFLHNTSTETIYSFLTSFGTVLFIAVIGIQSGEIFFESKGKKQWKAFLCGICIVTIGAIIAVGCGLLDSSIPPDLLVGLFSGSMTSTPAMSTALEAYGGESLVSVGYGLSYCIGLLSVVFFVQMLQLPYLRTSNETAAHNGKPSVSKGSIPIDSIICLSGAVLVGMFFALILPIGNTGGVLISGLLFGVICRKKKRILFGLQSIKTFGLILFFIGTGMTSGKYFCGNIYWRVVLYGATICVLAIGLGYFITHYVFRFSKTDTLSIICGSMTSTPAIGVLQDRTQDTDLSLYAASYVGALIALIFFVQTFVSVW